MPQFWEQPVWQEHLRQHGHIQRAIWMQTENFVIKIYKNGDTDTVTDESDEVTAAEQGNAIESAAEGFYDHDCTGWTKSRKKKDTEAAENSAVGQIECWAEVDSYLYKALGLEYNEEQKAWMWKRKTSLCDLVRGYRTDHLRRCKSRRQKLPAYHLGKQRWNRHI